MGWEKRGENLYYYQSERDEAGKVRKRYVGGGEIAELVAHADATRRRVREKRREEGQAELERMRDLVAPAFELDEAADALLRAHLVAAGYRERKGQWRLRRGRNA
jgi:hypothetical protein